MPSPFARKCKQGQNISDALCFGEAELMGCGGIAGVLCRHIWSTLVTERSNRGARASYHVLLAPATLTWRRLVEELTAAEIPDVQTGLGPTKRRSVKYLKFPAEIKWIWGKLQDLPTVSACYCIYLRGKVFYVGSTVNLRKRFHLHQIQTGRIAYRDFAGAPEEVTIKYSHCPPEHLRKVERILCKFFRPPHNLRFG